MCMYQRLESGKGLEVKEWCGSNQMSLSSFRRYVALLRDFYWQEKQTTIVYDQKTQKYVLAGKFNENFYIKEEH